MDRSYTSYHPGLMSDLYHPDAAYVAWRHGKMGMATFDLYARRSPFGGAYMLVAGLEMALEFVRAFHFTGEDLDFLSKIRDYEPGFLDYLAGLRFGGDIHAMPEGSIAFPDEPLVRVTAPFPEALLLESGMLQAINLATLLATKAARVVRAARGRRVAEFAFRRAQEPFVVTRSAFIGGCHSTSFLAGAYRFRLPASGSIPHALVQLFDTEEEAFAAVAGTYNRYVLLLDTYDPRRAIHTAVRVAREYADPPEAGHTLAAVRLDSGDIVADSRYCRAVLDEAGLYQVRILASGDLDEFRIVELLETGAPIDAFGVGTMLGIGAGSVEHGIEGGALGGVYKEILYVDELGASHPRIKLAGEKSTWPGLKQVYRAGNFEYDVIQLESELAPPDAQRLLRPVVARGAVLPGSLPPLTEIWELAQQNLKALPDRWQEFIVEDPYPVRRSPGLLSLRDQARIEAEDRASRGAPEQEPTR